MRAQELAPRQSIGAVCTASVGERPRLSGLGIIPSPDLDKRNNNTSAGPFVLLLADRATQRTCRISLFQVVTCMPLYIVRLDCHLHEGQQRPPRDLALVAAAPDMEKADLHKARRPYFVAGISDWTIVGACFCMFGRLHHRTDVRRLRPQKDRRPVDTATTPFPVGRRLPTKSY